jgi:DNA-binding NarL/FixJ family response regulator
MISPLRVVVADDQALVRSGFLALLRSEDGIEVVGEAANGFEAVKVCKAERPDVILMDIRMPEMDGLEATRLITSDPGLESVKILILTTFDLDAYVHEALRAGASGFLLKDTLPAELLAAVRVVAAGDALLAPSITRRLIEDFVKRPIQPSDDTRLNQLTNREREVLTEVGKGRSNAELADVLFMSHATAKTHVSHLLTKFAVRDRAQLVVIAYETALITPTHQPRQILRVNEQLAD